MIPDELKKLTQWVVAEADKVPKNPRTKAPASVTDPKTWGTYDEAVAAGTKHIGFVLTKNDPYGFIDLDAPLNEEQVARHNRVIEIFDSYTEVSQSGNGVHILVRGALPAGARRDRIEVYSDARYLIMTGRVIRDVPIRDYSELFLQLYTEMGNGGIHMTDLPEYDEVISDRELVEMAEAAVNGDKYLRLARGEWQGEYPSQSEADFAFLSMLAFYTRSNEQVMRLFRYSALGKRDKALRDDYLLRCLKKIRSKEPPPIEFDALSIQSRSLLTAADAGHGGGSVHDRVDTDVNHRLDSVPVAPPRDSTPATVHLLSSSQAGLEYPPGLVGDIARYIHDSSPRPVPEVAITAALALCAGIVGRQYNISNTGLNLYLILLGKTGIGKEGGTQGIERILAAMRTSIPLVESFAGPANYASGQSIIKWLNKQQCLFSVVGEFGLYLQLLSDQRAAPHMVMMRRILLDLYNKSGATDMLRPSAYSDNMKNTEVVRSPALTIYGESTPETFYDGLTQAQVADGLIPRFLIVEYEGARPAPNPNAFFAPPEELLQRFAEVVTTVLAMQANHSWKHLALDEEAEAMYRAFNAECDRHINEPGVNEALRQLWNRAALKAMKVAGLLAAVERPHGEHVHKHEFEWAMHLVRADIHRLLIRFEQGDVGNTVIKQTSDAERVVKEYLERSFDELSKYGVTESMYVRKIIPFVYFQRRLRPLAAFSRLGDRARIAVREAVEDLVNSGVIQEVPRAQMKAECGTTSQAFKVNV